MRSSNRGIWYGIGAYASWGVFPLYWKLLSEVPVLQVISHRILWSSVMLAGYVAMTGQGRALRSALRRPEVLRAYASAAALIGINWFVFIWAVGAGYVVECSLGYYINPLLSVLLGVWVFDERLRPGQWAAVAIAACGVAYLTITVGRIPWISLLLATSFALYGLVKKRAPLASVPGLTLETGLLAPIALGWLLWSEHSGDGAFLHQEPAITALLLGAGAVTTAPLLMFATAAQNIPLLWIGILQYIAPTMQLAIGVLVFGEPFSGERLAGFALVWAALLLFALEGLYRHRTSTRALRAREAAAEVQPPPE